MVGGVISATVIVKLQVLLLPTTSVAFHVTVLVPRLKTKPFNVFEPLPVVAPVTVYVLVTAPGQLSVAALLGLLPLLALVACTGLWIYLTFLIPLAFVRWRLIGW